MRIIKCEDCVNFRDGQCAEYGKERDSALKDCLHNGGFIQYRPREEGRCGITEQEVPPECKRGVEHWRQITVAQM